MSSFLKETLKGPVLTVEDLCHFVQRHFGGAAVDVAQQHVDAYRSRGHHDIAATWAEVHDQLKQEDLNTKRVA